jgi:enoyl-CoA hydratase
MTRTAKPDGAPVIEIEAHGPVSVQRNLGVMTVTINRPEVRNAINLETAIAIATAMEELDSDPELTIGIITGANGTFCTGMDLKAFLAGQRPVAPNRGFAGLVERPPDKPLIAAVEGYAIAGGFEIALACDLIVAANDAKFGLPETKRGLVAAGGGLLRLPARVPYHLAMEWALLGDFISAEQAHEVGLVNRLTEPGGALAAAQDLAASVSKNGPLAVRATKKIIQESRNWSGDEAFQLQRAIADPVRASDDAKEGARAFTEKRRPDWKGK